MILGRSLYCDEGNLLKNEPCEAVIGTLFLKRRTWVCRVAEWVPVQLVCKDDADENAADLWP